MAVNLSQIKDLLLPGLRGVEGKYEQIPSQYDKIFTKHDSKMALERTERFDRHRCRTKRHNRR